MFMWLLKLLSYFNIYENISGDLLKFIITLYKMTHFLILD